MRKQRGFVQILLIAGIAVAFAVIGYVFYRQGLVNKIASIPVPGAYQAQYTQGQASAPQVQSGSDLNKASASLDSADTTRIDTELNALNQASSGF